MTATSMFSCRCRPYVIERLLFLRTPLTRTATGTTGLFPSPFCCSMLAAALALLTSFGPAVLMVTRARKQTEAHPGALKPAAACQHGQGCSRLLQDRHRAGQECSDVKHCVTTDCSWHVHRPVWLHNTHCRQTICHAMDFSTAGFGGGGGPVCHSAYSAGPPLQIVRSNEARLTLAMLGLNQSQDIV